jgi:hypothetical protein
LHGVDLLFYFSSLGIALNKGVAKDLPFLPFAFFWAFALYTRLTAAFRIASERLLALGN